MTEKYEMIIEKRKLGRERERWMIFATTRSQVAKESKIFAIAKQKWAFMLAPPERMW